MFPISGELHVFGEPPYENNRVLSKICFIKESRKYPDSFRVIDVIGLCPSIFPNWNQELARKLLIDFNLPLRRRIKKLSRVGIIIGLASLATLTIFDEPYLGLDVAVTQTFSFAFGISIRRTDYYLEHRYSYTSLLLRVCHCYMLPAVWPHGNVHLVPSHACHFNHDPQNNNFLVLQQAKPLESYQRLCFG